MNKSISIILIRTEKGIINCALESIRKNGCSNIIMLDLDCISEIQSKLSNISTDYAMLMTDQFALAYDTALNDALAIIANNPIACFGTDYEADDTNKFDPHRHNLLMSPSIMNLKTHPSSFLACIFSREICSKLIIKGRNACEVIIGCLLQKIVEHCLFIPINILSTPLHASDINSLIQGEYVLSCLKNFYPLLAEDYKSLLSTREEDEEKYLVLNKLSKTWFFKAIMSTRELLKRIGYYNAKANFKHNKYLKNVRKADTARIAEITKCIEALSINALQPNGDNSDVVVSLTSHGKRLSESAPFAIYSLFTQTVLPNRIVLCINQELWNENNLPPLIKRLQKSGLEVIFCRDVRSHTKLLPTLSKYPNNPIITVDDDMLYEPHMIEELLMAYEKSDKKTVLCRQGVYPRKKDGRYLSYMKWDDSPHLPDSIQNKFSHCVSPYGVYGVLYPPQIFDTEIFQDDIFLKIAPHTDDIWFWIQEVRCGIKAEVIRPTRQRGDKSVSLLEYIEENESTALYFQNCFEGRNDKEMYALLNYYGM